MKIVDDVRAERAEFTKVVLTVGSFDGIHLGHRRILDAVVEAAKRLGGVPSVLTMRPHPRVFFAQDHAPNLLTSERKKLQLLEEAGIEAVFVLPFNAETADIEALDFIHRIVCGQCKAKALVVGHDCRFGKGAKGDFELLERVAPENGFTVEQVPPLVVGTERVSSTLIRERVLQGDLEHVQVLLGRKYSVMGEVVTGRGMGVKLGFPTANVKPHHSAVPAQGVYIAEVLVAGRKLPAAVNIGIAPTIRHEDVTIEAHVLDFSQEILGEEIEIVFHKRVRPEKKFGSHKELTDQIDRDVEAARAYFRSQTQ